MSTVISVCTPQLALVDTEIHDPKTWYTAVSSSASAFREPPCLWWPLPGVVISCGWVKQGTKVWPSVHAVQLGGAVLAPELLPFWLRRCSLTPPSGSTSYPFSSHVYIPNAHLAPQNIIVKFCWRAHPETAITLVTKPYQFLFLNNSQVQSHFSRSTMIFLV